MIGLPMDQILKHRSCWMHLLAVSHGQEPTEEQVNEIRGKYGFDASCFFGGVTRRERSRRSICAADVYFRNEKVDSERFHFLFGNIWRSIPETKRTAFVYLDCMWFSMYLQAPYKTKVLSWIKRKEIFSKKYVLVPILCWNHWNLLILCDFGESLSSNTRKPCMFLLDSLKMSDPTRLGPNIKKFVLDLYQEEGVLMDKKAIYKIPLLVPKVPQQKNNTDCGILVLYYMSMFLKAAPENIVISKNQPDFITPDWFDPEKFDCFCSKLARELYVQKKFDMDSFGMGSSSSDSEELRENDVICLL